MQSGKFLHRITIEAPVRNQNDNGDIGDTWAPLAGFERIPAEVLPDRAGEFFATRQIQATRNALVRMYYRPGIDEKMRVVHHVRPGTDEFWDIAGCIPFQYRQVELRLMCIWRESQGYRRGADLQNPEDLGA